jgi:hypothetical protein
MLASGHNITTNQTSAWTRIAVAAAPGQPVPYTPAQKTRSSPVYINRTKISGKSANLDADFVRQATSARAPPATLTSAHVWPNGLPLPTWDTEGACFAAAYGAQGDYITDDTAAIQAMLRDPNCTIGVLGKGYFSVSSTLDIPAGFALLGVGRVFTNIVPHASVDTQSGADPWPLVRTTDTPRAGPRAHPLDSRTKTSLNEDRDELTVVSGLSLLVWRHLNRTFACEWLAANGIWRRAHTNRVDFTPNRPMAYYNRPLNTISDRGGGSFYNFYQENWDGQGPLYRHLLVNHTSGALSCYHCNTEHSQGEANLEIVGATGPVRIYGFKGEGNYAQIWVRDSTDFFLGGYGGNASPFPFRCQYPPGFANYTPSILRLENVSRAVLGNLIVQLSSNTRNQCGLFDTGFAGTFYPPDVWSVLLDLAPPPQTDSDVDTTYMERSATTSTTGKCAGPKSSRHESRGLDSNCSLLVPALEWPTLYAVGVSEWWWIKVWKNYLFIISMALRVRGQSLQPALSAVRASSIDS